MSTCGPSFHDYPEMLRRLENGWIQSHHPEDALSATSRRRSTLRLLSALLRFGNREFLYLPEYRIPEVKTRHQSVCLDTDLIFSSDYLYLRHPLTPNFFVKTPI